MSFTRELLKYKNQIFVETGTFLGETVEIVSDSKIFHEVRTVELSPYYHNMAVERFKSIPNLKLYMGNSRLHLFEIIQDIQVPITFWLDACWMNVFHVGIDIESLCPILEELEQIKNHPVKSHTIIINNLNKMNGEDIPVKKMEVLRKLLEINARYKIKYYNDKNIIVAYSEVQELPMIPGMGGMPGPGCIVL